VRVHLLHGLLLHVAEHVHHHHAALESTAPWITGGRCYERYFSRF
jgi:hypothetical protein